MNGAGVGGVGLAESESTSESERTSSAFSNENRDDACANVSRVAPSGSQSRKESVSDPNEYGSSHTSLFSVSFATRVERSAFFFAVSSARLTARSRASFSHVSASSSSSTS